MNDMPLGFGVIAKSTAEIRHADPTAMVVYHQGDLGQYLRQEEHLT
jgi:60S ribosome subunit biogenesis protein NIP7